eukprot:274865-Chlamydomonas_euryale.AAC.2
MGEPLGEPVVLSSAGHEGHLRRPTSGSTRSVKFSGRWKMVFQSVTLFRYIRMICKQEQEGCGRAGVEVHGGEVCKCVPRAGAVAMCVSRAGTVVICVWLGGGEPGRLPGRCLHDWGFGTDN